MYWNLPTFFSSPCVVACFRRLPTGKLDGWLWKQAGMHDGKSRTALGHKAWKRRWFVLEGTTLSYYESPKGAVKGTVDLANCTAVEVLAQNSYAA